MTTLIADSINYKMANVIHGEYQWNKSYPIEGLTNYSLASVNQGPTTTFKLAPHVMNLAKSKLCGTISIAQQGAGNYTFLNVNGFKAINKITVQAETGAMILDTTDIDRYLDIVSRRRFSFSDVQTWDPAQTYANYGGGNPTFFEGLIPSDYAAATNVRLDNSAMAKVGQESQWVCAGGANAATNLDFKIGFDKFVDTILAVDKDLFWINNLTVTIYWNPLAKYCWMGTSATNPSTGAAALAVPAGAAIVNPYIMVAIQTNKVIQRDIEERCRSQMGLTIKVPYLLQTSNPIAAGGNNFTAWYTPGQGSHLQKIYWSVYPQTPASPNLTYDKNNLANAKISLYRTLLNNENIQQNDVNPISGDGFMMARNSLRGSDTLSFNEYLYNWSHEENFVEQNYQFLKTLFPDVPDDNLIDGIPLLGQIQYNIVSTSVVNLTNVLFAVVLKTLRISGEFITIQ